jgi:hypothetical protein
MLAIIAAVLFFVAAVLSGVAAHTNDWTAPITLLCFGLGFLALHVSGVSLTRKQ